MAVAVTNENPAVVRGFLEGMPFPFPVLLDKGGKVADTYRVDGIPVTVAVDRTGQVAQEIRGFAEELFRPEFASHADEWFN